MVSDDGNTIAGILSERDIVRALARKGPECLAEPVEEYMTTAVQICALSDSADAILGRMTEGPVSTYARYRKQDVGRPDYDWRCG